MNHDNSPSTIDVLIQNNSLRNKLPLWFHNHPILQTWSSVSFFFYFSSSKGNTRRTPIEGIMRRLSSYEVKKCWLPLLVLVLISFFSQDNRFYCDFLARNRALVTSPEGDPCIWGRNVEIRKISRYDNYPNLEDVLLLLLHYHFRFEFIFTLYVSPDSIMYCICWKLWI